MQTIKTELAMDVPAATQYDPPLRGMAPFKREYCIFPPQGPNAVTQTSTQSIVRFRFPNTGYLDPSKTFLRFGMQVNVDQPTVQNNTITLPSFAMENVLDPVGASAVIDKFRVFASGQVIEDITNYADVVRLLQLQHGTEHLEGMSGVMQGTEGNTVLYRSGFTAGGAAAVGPPVVPAESQTRYDQTASFTKLARGGRIPWRNESPSNWRYFNIPLLPSGIFGPKAQDFLPLWLLGGDFEIEITFAPGTSVFRTISRSTGAAHADNAANQIASYNMRDISLQTQVISLPDVFTSALLSKVREGATIKFAFTTYSVSRASIQGSTDIVNIPVHYSDVTAIYLLRKANNPDAAYCKSQFEGDAIEYAQLQLGSNLIPQQPITNYVDLYLNLLHATNKTHNPGNPVGILPSNWGIAGNVLVSNPDDTETTGSVKQANTIVAFDLRKYHKSNVMSGVPIEGNATITMKYSAASATNFIQNQINLVVVQNTRLFILAAEGVAILR